MHVVVVVTRPMVGREPIVPLTVRVDVPPPRPLHRVEISLDTLERDPTGQLLFSCNHIERQKTDDYCCTVVR